jgi:hypothetical protein
MPARVPRGAPILISGWTVDSSKNAGAVAVCALVNRVVPFTARVGIARGDLRIDGVEDEFLGFQVVIPTSSFEPGGHEVRIFALSDDGHWYEAAQVAFDCFVAAYPSGVEKLSRSVQLHIDHPIDTSTGRSVGPGEAHRQKGFAIFTGWAFDDETRSGVGSVIARDTEGRFWLSDAQVSRPDVASRFPGANPRLGFELAIPTSAFTCGEHELTFLALDHTGRAYANAAFTWKLLIDAAQQSFPETAREVQAEGTAACRLRVAASRDDFDDFRTLRVLPRGNRIERTRGAILKIDGWACSSPGVPAPIVYVEIKSERVAFPPGQVLAESRLRSIDEAEYFAKERPASAFFRVEFSVRGLASGLSSVSILIPSSDRREYQRIHVADIDVAPDTKHGVR